MPRTIQTKVLAKNFNGLNLLIEQNAIGKPNGMPISNVTAKIIKDIIKPFAKNEVISKKDIKFPFTQILLTGQLSRQLKVVFILL